MAGAISEVLVDDNQLLKKGDPIARLDPRDYEMALAVSRRQPVRKIHFVALFLVYDLDFPGYLPFVEFSLYVAGAGADSRISFAILARTFRANAK